METSWTMESRPFCQCCQCKNDVKGMIQKMKLCCWMVWWRLYRVCVENRVHDGDDVWYRGKFHFKWQKTTISYTNFAQSSMHKDIRAFWPQLLPVPLASLPGVCLLETELQDSSPVSHHLTLVSLPLNSDSAVTSINGSPAVWNHL